MNPLQSLAFFWASCARLGSLACLLVLLGTSGCSSVGSQAPVDLEAWRLLARGRAQLALEEFEHVEPEGLDAMAGARWELGRSRALAALGRAQEATAAIERSIELLPSAAQGHVDLGVLWLEQGDAARALVAFDEALLIDGTLAVAAYDRGLALDQLGSNEAAAEAFTRATELDPALAEAHNALGVILARGGDLERAASAFRIAAENGGGTPARLNLAEALLHLEDARTALVELNAAVRLAPSEVEPLLARAEVILRLGDLELAAEDFEAALTLDPTRRDIHSPLAAILKDR